MEIIILKTQVDKTSLDLLERQVNGLNNRVLKFIVDTSGIDKLTNAQAKVLSSANNLAVAQERTKQAVPEGLYGKSTRKR